MKSKRGKDKRGIELSMNIIIIAILAILVLVIIAVFVTGGLSNLFSKIKSLYGGQATDISTKIASCNTLCQQFSATKSTLYKTQYCTLGTNIDKNGDGQLTEDEKDVKCPDIISCAEITC